MKKMIKLFTLFLSVILISTSCKKDDDPTPNSIAGKWLLQSYESEVKQINEPSEKESENISSENIFIEFKADGTFNTNSIVSASEIISEESVSGSYEIKDGFLIMKYKDSETKTDELSYAKVESSSNSLKMIIDKETLKKSAEELSKTNPDEAVWILVILEAVERFNVTLTYKKA